ncbi:MAG: winged helix-turn-helix transcriptional regulator [Cytophagales bacterium]|nr:winged helix-turn-helix transcriptional regulator [Cytophagales bacterium]
MLQTIEKNKDITVPELAIMLDVSPRTIERHLKELKDGGKIRRTGSRKTGHWEIIG